MSVYALVATVCFSVYCLIGHIWPAALGRDMKSLSIYLSIIGNTETIQVHSLFCEEAEGGTPGGGGGGGGGNLIAPLYILSPNN